MKDTVRYITWNNLTVIDVFFSNLSVKFFTLFFEKEDSTYSSHPLGEHISHENFVAQKNY